MTPAPLAGRQVVVTRARAQASSLVGRLESLGALVVELPAIAIEEPDDGGLALETAAHRLVSGDFRWVVLTSPNAAHRLLAAVGDRAISGTVGWAVVGAGTARALTDGGVTPDLVSAGSTAESLVAEFPPAEALEVGRSGQLPAESRSVLFPRAETVRDVVASGLTSTGWTVDEVVAYRTVAGSPTPEALAAAGRAEAIAFTSSSTVTRSVQLLGTARIPPIIVSIGPVTSESARAAGLSVTAEASPHTVEGVVHALVTVLGHRSPGQPGRPGRPGPQGPLGPQGPQQQQ